MKVLKRFSMEYCSVRDILTINQCMFIDWFSGKRHQTLILPSNLIQCGNTDTVYLNWWKATLMNIIPLNGLILGLFEDSFSSAHSLLTNVKNFVCVLIFLLIISFIFYIGLCSSDFILVLIYLWIFFAVKMISIEPPTRDYVAQDNVYSPGRRGRHVDGSLRIGRRRTGPVGACRHWAPLGSCKGTQDPLRGEKPWQQGNTKRRNTTH